MVDVKNITNRLLRHFHLEGTYTIDPDTGVVNVDGSVGLLKTNQQQLAVQFGVVTGNFFCKYHALTTLKGAPREVHGDFSCIGNWLHNLAGSPSHVGGNFDCSDNKIYDLTHAPSLVGGDFFCYNNKLTSLVGSPRRVLGSMDVTKNPLHSLEGAPEYVKAFFYVSYSRQLPLLRLCMYERVYFGDRDQLVTRIMNKYHGTGRPGALLAAAELIRAGYAGNARW